MYDQISHQLNSYIASYLDEILEMVLVCKFGPS